MPKEHQAAADDSLAEKSLDLELSLMPDWAKESSSTKNPYADYEGEARGRSGGGRDRRGGGRDGGGDRSRPRRPAPRDRERQGGGSGGPGAGNRPDFRRGGGQDRGGPRQSHGPQAQGEGNRHGGGQGRDRKDERGGYGPRSGDRRGQGGPQDRGGFQRRGPVPEDQRPEAFGLKVNFIPDAACVESLVNQLRTVRKASSLFSIAKLFLGKPERYQLRIKPVDENVRLFQLGEDGPVSMDKQQLEADAFEAHRQEYYSEEVSEQEEIKGNFTAVARCRPCGTLLGPTNHHAYQRNLRSLYEERYRSQMNFERFRDLIEVINDPEVVVQWKEQARRVSIFTPLKEENPAPLNSLADARRHFSLNHLNEVIKERNAVTVGGKASRRIPDPAIQKALRGAYEMEIRFPNRLAQTLRAEFVKSGLFVFKHRKRMLYVYALRPKMFRGDNKQLAPQLSAILQCIEKHPGIDRHGLSRKLIPELNLDDAAQEQQKEKIEQAKNELAINLHWLVHEGYVIEFHDNTLDFPLPQQREGESDDRRRKGGKDRAQKSRQQQIPDAQATTEAGAGETTPSSEEPAADKEDAEPGEAASAPSSNGVEEPAQMADRQEKDASSTSEVATEPAANAAKTEAESGPASDQASSEPEEAPSATPSSNSDEGGAEEQIPSADHDPQKTPPDRDPDDEGTPKQVTAKVREKEDSTEEAENEGEGEMSGSDAPVGSPDENDADEIRNNNEPATAAAVAISS